MGVEVKPGDIKLLLRGEPGEWDAPVVVRLRRLLKLILRGFGLRVVWCAEVPAGEKVDVSTNQKADTGAVK